MNKKDLDRMQKLVGEQVNRLRGLGVFDANAEPILLLTEWVYLIVEYLNKKPAKKSKRKK